MLSAESEIIALHEGSCMALEAAFGSDRWKKEAEEKIHKKDGTNLSDRV